MNLKVPAKAFMAFEKIMDIIWQKETFRLLPEKAIHWPAEKTLFVADPHFGKSATFRKVGIPISDENSKDDCKKLLTLCENTQVRKIIFLGDFLHARQGRSDSVRKLLGEWRSNCLEIELHLVRVRLHAVCDAGRSAHQHLRGRAHQRLQPGPTTPRTSDLPAY
ncbi:MAG: hypothetical protein VX839_05615, partial [Verrucomicrobiota bacterium]|nr:hypothetical protein [Verrucomicrobiota bacterium]